MCDCVCPLTTGETLQRLPPVLHQGAAAGREGNGYVDRMLTEHLSAASTRGPVMSLSSSVVVLVSDVNENVEAVYEG